ncbi:uncharacterized protein LOC131853082 [Achroia grisella]|uniref:uncharacterized protein LOC131853082 n=1 Tax=Achroia grisella TaxID=688607 RepID=UPI0027D29352|nr:uncharacterized protein LOC131853082 [Achroia grisella]
MNFTFLCLVITQYVLHDVYARYNKDVICVIDKGQNPTCKAIPSSSRRNANLRNNDAMPTYDPYIPRTNVIFYNCSSSDCKTFRLHSITEVTSPELMLKVCFLESTGSYECETVRYNHLKNVDKLLFLNNNIKNKIYYIVDCLVFEDRGRVCHRRNGNNPHTKLVDTGSIVRPKEPNILSQHEFICEEDQQGLVNCDINPFIPFDNNLKLKQSMITDNNVLLKTGNYVLSLKKNCVDAWCGYSGIISRLSGRRYSRYEPPGGKVYRCYYAKKQQICKELYGQKKSIYNERAWLST